MAVSSRCLPSHYRSRRQHSNQVSLCYFSPLCCAVTLGQAQPLVQEPVVWTADVPLTTGQLRGRRDTFWDTAPMYDGRREIWDALRAAVEAAEQEDYDLAQAILSGANITLPTGTHTPHNHSTSSSIRFSTIYFYPFLTKHSTYIPARIYICIIHCTV